MPVSEKLKSLVEQLPPADARGMYDTDIDKDKIEKTFAELCQGGVENVLGLVEMLGEPGSAQDVKPHYALHGVLNHVLVTKNEAARKEFCAALAGQLAGDHSKYVRGYLCQELQWAGHEEAVPALGKLLLDEDLAEPAKMALVIIGTGATAQLLAALADAKGKCRLAVIHGLAALAEPPAAAALGEALADPDREVRIAAGAGLAKLGSAAACEPLLKAAAAGPGWERVQQTKHCLVLAEKLAAAGNKPEAAKIYRQLRDSRTDPAEKYIRDAADKALAALA
jgi:HEAT repeat protein